MTNPGAGKFLISDPFLPDPNFSRTVVYLGSYDEAGAVGFVVNRPSDLTLEEVLPGYAGIRCKIFLGGPVEQNTLHFIHCCEKLADDSKAVQPGIFWGGNLDEVVEALRNGEMQENEVRFFAGYSGWSAGQLDDELVERAWFVTDAGKEYIFSEHPDVLWKEVLSGMGGDFSILGNSPLDPRWN